MFDLLTDILIVFTLILFNGFFAGAEIAVLTLRPGKFQSMQKEFPNSGAIKRLAKLKQNPDRFIATIQIGITLLSTMSAAYGGARLLMYMIPMLEQINVPIVDVYKEEIALALLVLAISYLSLLFGELIPKSLALSNSGRFSKAVAYPLHIFSVLFHAFVNVLIFSSEMILRLFNRHTNTFAETRVHEDEIRSLLQEGVQAGLIDCNENEIINNIFDINDKTAREIMTPRINIDAISLQATDQQIEDLIVKGKRSLIPVYQNDLDTIEGILDVKEFLRGQVADANCRFEAMLHPAFHVPEGMKLDKILQEMKNRRTYMAIVHDEYGGTSGLITLEDIIEEIVGDIQDKDDRVDEIMVNKISDTVAIIHGACPIHEFNKNYKDMPIPESDAYISVAGYVIESIGRFPEVGEKIQIGSFQFQLLKRVRQSLREFRLRIINLEQQAQKSETKQVADKE